MRIRLPLALALLLLAACGREEAPPAEMPMPDIYDVLPLAHADGSCACLLRRRCANLAERTPGWWEGRNLQCRVEDAGARTVRCRYEGRFWNEEDPAQPVPSEWQRRETVHLRYAHGAWCVGPA